MTSLPAEKRTADKCVRESFLADARLLCELMAVDDALWAPAKSIETGYVQQALRFLTRFIEGEWTYAETYDALKEMQP